MKKDAWVRLSLINLAVVALLGFALRSKILFPIPWLDYRHTLSAHSHFAFGAWVGLSLMTLLIYQLLPPEKANRKVYQWILWGIQLSSWGMALSFPFGGYYSVSIVFSTMFILVTYWFGIVFIRDLGTTTLTGSIKLLASVSLISLMASALGPILLSYILISKSSNSLLYRDAIYTFLHFQYNGFFALAVLALLLHRFQIAGQPADRNSKRFAFFLSLSVFPALFLSLLWHNSTLFYWIAGIACALIVLCLYYFIVVISNMNIRSVYVHPLSRGLLLMAVLSFILKMILNIGPIIPQLSNAVYGDRPVIIGFLHLVFLAFVSFYILAEYIRLGYFNRNGRIISLPFYVFAAGVISNELILMVQGLGILLRTNNDIYSWLLWFAAIILLMGGIMLAVSIYTNKKATENSVAPVKS